MPTAALYSRVSTESEDQLQALEQQQIRLREAVPDGYETVEFTDVLSGKSTDRPAFNRLMRAVSGNTVDLVIATRLDRLARNRTHGGQILDEFSMEGAPRLLLLDDQLDLGSVGGRLMAGILVSWSIAESERLGERTAHGHAHRRSLGKPFGPSAPRGYQWNKARDNYKLAPDADKYRDLVQRFQADPEIRKWLRWANEHGMPFASPSSISRWFQNPALAGGRVYGVSQKVRVTDERTGKTKMVRRHNKPGQYGEVFWDAHPALITREQHAWMLSFFEANRHRTQATAPLKEGRIRVVTGISTCAACGKRLIVHQSGKNAPRYYRCTNQTCSQLYKNRISEAKILEAALDELRRSSDQLAAFMVDAINSNEESPAIKKLRGEISDAKKLQNERMAPIIQNMERELFALEHQQRGGTATAEQIGWLEELSKTFKNPLTFELIPKDEMRSVLLTFIDSVVVDKGEVVKVNTKS